MARDHNGLGPINIRPGMSIGSIAAETDDQFLFECFTYHPAVDTAKNMQSPGMVISGRTGAGKTAILRHIEKECSNVSTIDLLEISMAYVSNSDTLRFLTAIGADIDLLFQSLWKHVLCMELIRLKYNVSNENKSKRVFSSFIQMFRDDSRRQMALNYLRNWEGLFWITADQNIKEITEKYEKNFQAEMGGEIEKFKARGQYEKQLSVEKKSELASRARKIIASEQLTELSSVIDMLSDQCTGDGAGRYFILIDRLDERWVDTSIRFRLVRALIESLRTFRKISNLKILIALRSDIFERVMQETGDITFQREKFDEYSIKLKWSKEQLKELVQKRIRTLYRRQYSPQKDVMFEDVFCNKVGNSDPFDFIIERTLLRPRDVIAFINECLSRAEGMADVNQKTIRNSEIEYSRIRRQALESEWKSAFPTLPMALEFIGNNSEINFPMSDILKKEQVEDLAIKIAGEEKIDHDPLYMHARNVFDGDGHYIFMQNVISILYRVGAIGIKMGSHDRFHYPYIDEPFFDPYTLTLDVRIRVHPMLHSTLNLSPHGGRRSAQRRG